MNSSMPTSALVADNADLRRGTALGHVQQRDDGSGRKNHVGPRAAGLAKHLAQRKSHLFELGSPAMPLRLRQRIEQVVESRVTDSGHHRPSRHSWLEGAPGQRSCNQVFWLSSAPLCAVTHIQKSTRRLAYCTAAGVWRDKTLPIGIESCARQYVLHWVCRHKRRTTESRLCSLWRNRGLLHVATATMALSPPRRASTTRPWVGKPALWPDPHSKPSRRPAELLPRKSPPGPRSRWANCWRTSARSWDDWPRSAKVPSKMNGAISSRMRSPR